MNTDRAEAIRRLYDDIKAIDRKLEARLQMVKALRLRRAMVLGKIAEQQGGEA